MERLGTTGGTVQAAVFGTPPQSNLSQSQKLSQRERNQGILIDGKMGTCNALHGFGMTLALVLNNYIALFE